MEKKSNPWWRDPRFIIPSILVPLVLAFIGLLPSILPDKISDKLSVTLSIRDPRRSESGLFDMTVEKTFVIDDESESTAARTIAHSILDNILSNQPTLKRNRKKIPMVVSQAGDGTLFISKPQNNELTLHLGRFANLQDLESLVAASGGPSAVQRVLVEPMLPTEASEISILDRKLRAGVYRIIVIAPGYNDHSTYIQLTDEGKIFTVSNSNDVVEIYFPMSLELNPRALRSFTIAIRPCHITLPASSKPKFTKIDTAIRAELANVFRQQGFIPVIVKDEQEVGFDLELSKGRPPTEGLVSADLLIENWRCEWMD